MSDSEEKYINAKRAVDNIINFVGTTIGLIFFIVSLLSGNFLIALGIFFGGWVLVLIARVVLTAPLTFLYAYLYDLNKNEDENFLPSSSFNKFKKGRGKRATDIKYVDTKSRDADDEAVTNDDLNRLLPTKKEKPRSNNSDDELPF